MSAFEVYVMMQADSVSNAMYGVGALFGTLSIASSFVWWMANMEGEPAPKGLLATSLGIASASAMVFMLAVLTPKTKTIAAMYVLPKVVANEQLKEDAAEIYNLAVEGLKKSLD